ncbi:hypothetical protein [Novosphingobium sp. SG707]|uniref:hypothetical protein n=1 Tax=Novosphingobium sp. SG707 TaxID=2586996 RepID=UPI0014465275|nr:hypothetical protein [Novosphingobium sp. SG707]NKJ00868.1 chorismate-pyruvate lyase [Novosphingobium sp. SG707]
MLPLALLYPLLLAHAGSLPAFEATLAAQDSATAALGQWCQARHLADPATIKAAQVKGEDTMPPPDLDETLKLSENQEPAHRHVRLSCGGKVLSEAHNWYARQRLTPAMNLTLDTTDTPFGKVAGPLGFTRERLGAVRGAAPGCPRDTVLSHRALLRLPDGSPLALVVECYTPAVLRK